MFFLLILVILQFLYVLLLLCLSSIYSLIYIFFNLRSTRESYGDNAVVYVQVKRERREHLVKGRVTPEHKVRSKSYIVTLVCNKVTQNIISVPCDGCAASAGGECKHVIAFLFRIHRKSSVPSLTEVECYWKKSKLASVGSTEKFIFAYHLEKKNYEKITTKKSFNFERMYKCKWKKK